MTFDYGKALTDSLKAIWKHKTLLWLALIPSLVGVLAYLLIFLPLILLSDSTEFSEEILLLILAVSAIFFSVLWFVVSVYFSGTATLGFVRVESGEASISVFGLLGDISKYLGRLLLANLIVAMTAGMIFTAFFACAAALSAVTMGLAAICLQPVFILITPLFFLLFGFVESAQVAVIKEDLSAMDALKKAYQIVREHVWKFLLVGVLVYVAYMIVTSIFSLALGIPMFAFIPLVELSPEEPIFTTMMIFALAFMALFMVGLFIMQAFVMAYMKYAFGLTYLRLTPDSENQVIFTA